MSGSMDEIRNEAMVKVDAIPNLVTMQSNSGAPDVRRFDLKAINDVIERNVSVMKPNEHAVAIGFITPKGAQVAVVGKLDSILGKKIPGDFRWTIYHTEPFKKGDDRETGAGFRWAI